MTYAMTDEHKKAISKAKLGHVTTEETKKKLSLIFNKRIKCNCDNCGKICYEKPSQHKKKKRHFCSRDCYSDFRKTKMPMAEQNAYKGIRKEGESKQVYHRNYCENNPENISHLKARRYAREKNAEGSHTLKAWKELKNRFNNKCASCRQDKKLTKDHIVPLSKGGTDYIENIQPLCRNCNSKKHNSLYESPSLQDK